MNNWTADGFKGFIGLVVAFAVAFWAGLEPLVQLLVFLMVVDIVTGLLVAFQTKAISSDISFKGMSKKAIKLILVMVANVAETYVGGALPLGEGVAGFYCATEFLSIIENAATAGVPVPKILKDALAKLNPEKPPE